MQKKGIWTKENYKMVMEGLTTFFLSPKALQRQNIYLRRGLFKPRGNKMQGFICCIKDMVYYLEDSPMFRNNQGLPLDKIIELVEFVLPCE